MDAASRSQIVEQEPGGGGQPAQTPDPAASRQIAYTYFFGFRVPTGNMEALLNAHRAACEQAGAAKCYVVNSSISGLGQEGAYASLELRGAADWMTGFKANMDDSLKPFEAELDSNNTMSEDLTVQLIDTSARLNSAKTLRDRLQELLRDRPGKLGELLEIERELARVQAEIDSTESILAAMRLRVAMSSVTLSYQARYDAVSESIWRPLGDAFGSFVPSIVGSLAAVVMFTAMALPWLLIVAGLVWFIVWLTRWVRRRPRRTQRPGPPSGAAVAEGPRPV
ncbi:MAG: DUF4349 domain-containing protein [Alphaproteobacteria bacterium]|nr:DUF4349 domain-containing protein [Alphaproteobacteria bacterium]